MVADGRLAASSSRWSRSTRHGRLRGRLRRRGPGLHRHLGQGLALMHEMLHWAVGPASPIVLSNVTRAMAPGWSIWSEQTDFLSQRDVGWMMLFAESVQEAQDFVIWLYRVASRCTCRGWCHGRLHPLPHLGAPDRARPGSGRCLPASLPAAVRPRSGRAALLRGAGEPGPLLRDPLQDVREHGAGRPAAGRGREEFGEVLGFRYGAVDPYMVDDADYVLVTAGAMSSNVRYAVKVLRERGIKVGMLRLVVFRPFPFQEVRRYLGGRAKGGGARPQHEPGPLRHLRPGGPRRPLPAAPPTDVYGYVLGIGGRDIRVETVMEVVEDLLAREEPERCLYVGVKGLPSARPGPGWPSIRWSPGAGGGAMKWAIPVDEEMNPGNLGCQGCGGALAMAPGPQPWGRTRWRWSRRAAGR